MNFDKDASFFAVYDGHGGPEIALYCSKYLPKFLKATEAYARGDFEQALRDAFLGFDTKLLAGDVIEELKVLAGDKYGYGEDDGADSDSDEDLAELKQEGGMPIEAVLSKYRSMVKNSPLDRVKGEEVGGSSSGGAGGSGSGSSSSSTAFKPHSPCLRAKKQSAISTSNGDAAEKPSGSCEEAVSSSSSSAKAATDNGASKESPDSSSTDATIGNSDAETIEATGSSLSATGSTASEVVAPTESTTANDVSSSSSTAAAAAALSSSADVEAGGSSSATPAPAPAAASSAVNGETSSSSSSGGISSTNAERAAKRVALSLSKPTAEDSDESDEDEKDMTYSENNSTDSEEKLDEEVSGRVHA